MRVQTCAELYIQTQSYYTVKILNFKLRKQNQSSFNKNQSSFNQFAIGVARYLVVLRTLTKAHVVSRSE